MAARKKATETEKTEAVNSLKTQGRGGCKLPRINMAFTPDNIEYLRIMSRACGLSMTELVNKIVADHAAAHADTVGKAKELLKSLDLGE